MSTHENIEKRLAKIAETIGEKPSVVDEVMKKIEAEAAVQSTNVKREFMLRRFAINRLTKLAAAAVVIVGILVGVNYFGGSVDVATIAFAEVKEAMQKVSWMHQVSRGFQAGVSGIAEQWVDFEKKALATKWADGKREYRDFENQKNIRMTLKPMPLPYVILVCH